MHSRRSWLAAAAALGWPRQPLAGGPRTLRFVRPQGRLVLEDWYPYQLLLAALAAGGLRAEVEAREALTQARAERELADPRGVIDLFVMGHTAAREQRLKMVPVPLYRGLFGWRLLLVRAARLTEFEGINDLGALRQLRLLQGDQWPDTEVLRSNRLRVLAGSTQLHRLHEGLQGDVADAFPRALHEAWRELDADPQRLAVLPGLALHYRHDLFFFTRRGEHELAQGLSRGLAALQRNGLHEALLRSHYGAAIARSQLDRRQVLRLDNPQLSAQLRAQPAALWTLPR